MLKLKNYNLKESNSDIFDIPIPTISDNYNKLSKFTMELPQKIIDSSEYKGYVIILDEFQLLKYIENPEAFFWLIRSYSQQQFNVSYIFTGSFSKTSNIVNMINGIDGAFGGRMIQIPINTFSFEETKEYLDKMVDNLEYSEKGFERFYKCTRGNPTYINSLAGILPNYFDENTIKEALEVNVDNVALIWLKIWGTLSDIEKEIIILIVEEEHINWKRLEELLSYSKSTIVKYIDLLNNKGIIEYNSKNEYILSDNMLKTWLTIKKENDGYYPK